MTQPVTVSIVTPCYNGARYLEETLRSAVNQTRPPLEVIVVDDGSTDESAALAERIGPPVRVIRQSNRGESAARNRGVAEARGTHVLFLDADDLLAPESIERLACAIDGQPGAVAVMNCAWFTDDPARPTHATEARQRSFYPDIIASNIAPPHSWLTSVDIVRAAGGFCETMRWFEDWDLWWRVGLLEPVIVPVAYSGALYRQHAASQLAMTNAADRARGHATLVGRMAIELLARPAWVERYGERLYWSIWSALNHARNAGIAWSELEILRLALAKLTRRGPAAVTSSKSALAFRWLGVRAGLVLQRNRI